MVCSVLANEKDITNGVFYQIYEEKKKHRKILLVFLFFYQRITNQVCL